MRTNERMSKTGPDMCCNRSRRAASARVLVVGGSREPSSPALVAQLAALADAVVAVDRGLDVLLAAELGCDLFCGDADSVSEKGAALVRDAETREREGVDGACAVDESPFVAEVECYNPHKDDTDLSLSLRTIEKRWPESELICTCLSGGHPDHALAVLGRLMAWNGSVSLEEDSFSAKILHAGDIWDIEDCAGSRFSFIPLSPEVIVSEEGMTWTLDHAHVPLLSDLGISNVLDSRARIICHDGTLVAYVFR